MGEELHYAIARDQNALAALSAQVEQEFEQRKLPTKVSFAIQLVLDEIISNILNHGVGEIMDSPIVIRLIFSPEEVAVSIEHAGEHFNPLEIAAPVLDQTMEERPIGGLGIHLTRNTMDSCEFAYRDGRNILLFRKKLGLEGSR